MIAPDLDGHGGRTLIQLPPRTVTVPIQQKKLMTSISNDDNGPSPFAKRRLEPFKDTFGRHVITLKQGSPHNPYIVSDHGLFHVGLMLGTGIDSPNAFVQGMFIAKPELGKSIWATRRVENYDDAKRLKKITAPKHVEDFDSWTIGDSVGRHGITNLTVCAGIVWMSGDARGGSLLEGAWSREIVKLSHNLIRVSFTRDYGFGGRAQSLAIPFSDVEGDHVRMNEHARVYLFNLDNEEHRAALNKVLRKNIIPGDLEAKKATQNAAATQLSARSVYRNRSTKTPIRISVPFIARAGISRHTDHLEMVLANRRNGNEIVTKRKAYLYQSSYRHINGPQKLGKSWKHFKFTHFQYHRVFAGTVKRFPVTRDHDFKKQHQRSIDVSLSFSHDHVKAKTVHRYLQKFARKVGINDYVIDTGYRENETIGYAKITYTLNVDQDALQHLIDGAKGNRTFFLPEASALIDTYFNEKNDPHGLCRSKIKSHNFCVAILRFKTMRALSYMSHKLRHLDDKKVRNSRKKTVDSLAKIARKLDTNQFVLNAFLMQLPLSHKSYSRLQIFGEQFLGEQFTTDPPLQKHLVPNAASDLSHGQTFGDRHNDELIEFDDDARNEGNDLI